MEAETEPSGATGDPAAGAGLRRSLTLLVPHRRLGVAVVVVAVLMSVAALLVPWVFGQAVDAVEAGNEERLVWFALAAFAAGTAVAVLKSLQQLLAGRLGTDVEFELRNAVFAHLLDLDLDFHGDHSAGRLVSLIMVSSRPVREFLTVAMPALLGDLLVFVIAGMAMAAIDWRLAALALWPLPISALLAARMGRVVTPMMRAQQELQADVTGSCDETLRQRLTVEVLDARAARREQFSRLVDRWASSANGIAIRGGAFDAALQNLPFLAWAGLFVVGGQAVLDQTLSLGRFVTFTGYVALMLDPLTNLSNRLWSTTLATAAAQRAFAVLDREPTVADPDDPRDPVEPRTRGAVVLRRVSLSHDGTDRALDAVDLEIHPRRTVGLLGTSGAGKSSLLDLVARRRDPDVGSVEVDGVPSTRWRLRDLRSRVVVVGSSPHLFRMSVTDNICYGLDGTDNELVEQIAAELGLDQEISALPEGLDTIVGPDATPVSATLALGISLARALALDPDVLLIDEATEGLPPGSEQRLLAGIARLGRRTVIIASTRRAPLELADIVVVLDGGRVVAAGAMDDVAAASPALERLLGDGDPGSGGAS